MIREKYGGLEENCKKSTAANQPKNWMVSKEWWWFEDAGNRALIDMWNVTIIIVSIIINSIIWKKIRQLKFLTYSTTYGVNWKYFGVFPASLMLFSLQMEIKIDSIKE